jgi:hypothetical protein
LLFLLPLFFFATDFLLFAGFFLPFFTFIDIL